MKHPIKSVSLLFILLFFSLACSFSLFGKDNDSSPAEEVSATGTLGDTYTSEFGGYSFKKVNGFDFSETIGIVQMTAPGSNPQSGPGILITGGLNTEEMTSEQLATTLQDSTSGYTFGKSDKIKVDGKKGLALDYEGTYEGQMIEGRIVVVMAAPLQQFTMVGVAPQGEWKNLENTFQKVVDTVQFVEPNPDALSGTSFEPATTGQSSGGQPLRQWASAAAASSEYGNTDWSAAQATGAPNAECGDDELAWASENTNGQEWLELTYYTPVIPAEINIHQNFNASQIVEVDVISLDGAKHVVWTGQAEQVDYCPDIMTITLSNQYQYPVIGVRLVVDYTTLGLSWNEIDAVELVGSTVSSPAAPSAPSAAQPDSPAPQEAEAPASQPAVASNANIPAPAGFLTNTKYQSMLYIIPGITMEADLPSIMDEPGKLSTENWKPRPDHANTYIYDLGEGVTAYVAVITSGEVYKTSISGVPKTMDVTVNNDLYQQMTTLYNQEYQLPYETVANLLGSPGLLVWHQLRDDGTMRMDYLWYNTKGDYISGSFIDGVIRGSAGFAYVVK